MSDSFSILRALPSVDELLRQPELAPLFQRALQCGGARARKELAARHIDGLRRAVREQKLDRAALERALEPQAQYRTLEALLLREEGAGLRRCVNATGVVLNTGLGRAPVHPEVAERMAEVARSYCVLEVDRWTNERNQRDDRLGALLTRLTGAEAAIAVNNCAAAVMLIFQTFAAAARHWSRVGSWWRSEAPSAYLMSWRARAHASSRSAPPTARASLTTSVLSASARAS